MTEAEILEKLQEAQKDQNFVDELKAQSTAEGLQKVLKAKGIDFTPEQVSAIAAIISENAEQELDEADLKTVAGGFGLLDQGVSIDKLFPPSIGNIIRALVGKPKIIPIVKPIVKKRKG